MKYVIIVISAIAISGCTQVQQAREVINAVDGSRIKILKLTHHQLKEQWHLLDRKNLEDRAILDSMKGF